jgi:hypothetical protein
MLCIFAKKKLALMTVPLICVLDVPGSNLSLEIGYPDRGFHGFSQFLEANVWTVLQIRHNHFLPYPFKFVIH